MWRFVCAALLLSAGTAMSHGQGADRAVTAVDLDIVPAQLDAFLAAAKENGAATSKEPGNVAYVIAQSKDDPYHILLVEIYKGADGVAAHRASDHFKKYMQQTKDMVAKRASRPMNSIAVFGTTK